VEGRFPHGRLKKYFREIYLKKKPWFVIGRKTAGEVLNTTKNLKKRYL
jgi:dihydrofolate reductase